MPPVKPNEVVNPYSKNRKFAPTSNTTATSSQQASSSSNGNSNSNTSSSSSIPRHLHAATFSQAFEGAEESLHYQQLRQELQIPLNPLQEQEKAEQRALDLAEVQVPSTATDRDHHILLQPHVLYVSVKQRGNGVLKFIRNVPFAFSKMIPDYILSSTSCALFLSIKYHNLYPAYVHRRLGELRTDFTLRILLVLVDVDDNANALLFLNNLAVTHNLTLILAWTEQEAARYLETFKALNGKDASSIQKREQTNFVDQAADFLTACKPVNKTDAENLLKDFSKVRDILAADKDQLAVCTGLGPIKVQKLHDALHKPFSRLAAAKRKKERLEKENKAQENPEVGSVMPDTAKRKREGQNDSTAEATAPSNALKEAPPTVGKTDS